MALLLELLFGPKVPENPYYEIIQDITILAPSWYPHFIAGCMIVFLILLWACHRGNTERVVLTTATRPKRRRWRTRDR